MNVATVSRTIVQTIRLISLADAEVSPQWVFAFVEGEPERRPAGMQMPLICMRLIDGKVETYQRRSVHALDLCGPRLESFLEYIQVLCETVHKRRGRGYGPPPWWEGKTPEEVAELIFFAPKQISALVQANVRKGEATAE